MKKCLFPLNKDMVSCPTCPKNLEWYLINRGHSERRGREEMSAISRVSLISQWSIIDKILSK